MSKFPRGFTALELIIVLTVGCSVIALSASQIGKLFSAQKITQAADNIINLAVTARLNKSPSGYGPPDDNLIYTFAGAGMLPKSLRTNANGVVTNEWGGHVAINPIRDGGFYISYGNVPPAACIRLTNALASRSIFSEVQIWRKPIPDNPSLKDISTACQPQGRDAGVHLSFVMAS